MFSVCQHFSSVDFTIKNPPKKHDVVQHKERKKGNPQTMARQTRSQSPKIHNPMIMGACPFVLTAPWFTMRQLAKLAGSLVAIAVFDTRTVRQVKRHSDPRSVHKVIDHVSTIVG
jgi:hypothetical protein